MLPRHQAWQSILVAGYRLPCDPPVGVMPMQRRGRYHVLAKERTMLLRCGSMSMSSAGRAGNSNGCVIKPKGRETGLSGFAAQIQLCSLTGSYVMATAEHREPYESRGSRTVLGARGGEIPPRDSTKVRITASQHWQPVHLKHDDRVIWRCGGIPVDLPRICEQR